MEVGLIGCQPPSNMRRRSRIGICLQLVTSKFWSFLHDSMITKIPSAKMVVSADLNRDRVNYNRTGELGRSEFEGFQSLATPNVRSGIIANTGIVEDQHLERRG